MKSTRIHVALDNVGCLSVVVLGVAFRWVLALRLGWTGFLGWAAGFLVALTIVSLLVGKKTRTKTDAPPRP